MEPPRVIVEVTHTIRVPTVVWVALVILALALAGSAITVANRIDPPPSRVQP